MPLRRWLMKCLIGVVLNAAAVGWWWTRRSHHHPTATALSSTSILGINLSRSSDRFYAASEVASGQAVDNAAAVPPTAIITSIVSRRGKGSSKGSGAGALREIVSGRLDMKLSDSRIELSDSIAGDGTEFTMLDPAIILFCYNRPEYLDQTLKSLAGLPQLKKFAVYVSQDGHSSSVAAIVTAWQRRLRKKARKFEHWQRPRVPLKGHSHKQLGHAWLSQHYKWGLDRVFHAPLSHSHVIVVEDDMVFSPDFLHFFQVTAVLLEKDPSLWCVSSWNDNGHADGFDWRPERLLRTSYFPGLGWMMRAPLWQEIGASWPPQAWDHWIRLSSVARDRDCIAPEVNRNRNIGEVGANVDKRFFRDHLSQMNWQAAPVHNFGDLSYLVAATYEERMRALLERATLRSAVPQPQLTVSGSSNSISGSKDRPLNRFAAAKEGGAVTALSAAQAFDAPGGQVYLVVYRQEDYEKLARHLHIWTVPRGHFQHVAILPNRGSLFLLADARASPLLPEGLRVRATPGLLPVAAQAYQSCDTACEEAGQTCNSEDIWFVNTCEALSASFPCEAGCSLELGAEIPCYVIDSKLATSRQCLVTESMALCRAKHKSTARLCPCIPLPAVGTTLVGGKAAALASNASKHADFAWLNS